MKINTILRIIRATKKPESNLVRLSEVWRSKVRLDQDMPSPVTCVMRLCSQVISVLFVGLPLFAIVFGLMFSTLCFLDRPSWKWQSLGVVVGLLICRHLAWPMRPGNRTLADQNAIDFVETIERLEDLLKEEFVEWDFENPSGSSDLKGDLRSFLVFEAREKDTLSRAGWCKQKAAEKMRKWTIYHALITGLFPDLPKDYNAYFPTRNSQTES